MAPERPWEADPGARFLRRLGRSPQELGVTSDSEACPDIWELDTGDIAVIGRDFTEQAKSRLPEGVSVAPDERVVVMPRSMAVAAKKDMPDA